MLVLEALARADTVSIPGYREPVTTEPLVSSGITGEPVSATFDAGLARVDGKHVKVVAWYDNERGFSNRVVGTLELLARE